MLDWLTPLALCIPVLLGWGLARLLLARTGWVWLPVLAFIPLFLILISAFGTVAEEISVLKLFGVVLCSALPLLWSLRLNNLAVRVVLVTALTVPLVWAVMLLLFTAALLLLGSIP